MKRFWITVARLASAAWVGAAALFLATALREVRHLEFDSATKDALALLRFPAYYTCGFALVLAALVGALCARFCGTPAEGSIPAEGRSENCSARHGAAAVLLGIALALMVGDFIFIYHPIVAMVSPPGRTRPAEFRSYHQASMWLNACDVGLCAVAAVLLCWPAHIRRRDVPAGKGDH